MNNRLLNYKKACILSDKYVNADADFSTSLDLLNDHAIGLLKLSLFTRKELRDPSMRSIFRKELEDLDRSYDNLIKSLPVPIIL